MPLHPPGCSKGECMRVLATSLVLSRPRRPGLARTGAHSPRCDTTPGRHFGAGYYVRSFQRPPEPGLRLCGPVQATFNPGPTFDSSPARQPPQPLPGRRNQLHAALPGRRQQRHLLARVPGAQSVPTASSNDALRAESGCGRGSSTGSADRRRPGHELGDPHVYSVAITASRWCRAAHRYEAARSASRTSSTDDASVPGR